MPCHPAEPRSPAESRRPALTCATAATAATTTTLATAPTTAMASPTVLTFDDEGIAVDFDVWVDDLQLFLQCDSRDGVSLFDHTSGVSTAPAATVDSTVRSQWTTHDAVARLAVRSHLPPAERTHFGQYKIAQSLYDAVVARYSSPATAALSHLMLPYLFPDLTAFATVADLVAHLRASDARYRAALPTDCVCPYWETPHQQGQGEQGWWRGQRCRRWRRRRRWRWRWGWHREWGRQWRRWRSWQRWRRRWRQRQRLRWCWSRCSRAAWRLWWQPAPAAAAHPGEVCGLPHTMQRSFGCLTDAWRTQFPDAVELPRWHDLLLQNVPIFDLDIDAILAAMYALADSAEGDCYLSVLPDPGIAAAALGASASARLGTSASTAPGAGAFALSGTAPTESLHTFTLDSGALRSFFRDSTMLTPLSRPVVVSLADPSGGPVLAHSSTVLPCPAAPSGLLSGLHLPSFSTNLVAASSQVFAAASRSSPASAPCSCRPLAHETLLWHHRLGHPSLPRLQGMASRALVSRLPRSLPPLPPGPAPTCVPCVEGRQRAAPHSSSFPPTEAPLQTLHMDVKGEVLEVLIDWIRGARRQLSESFGSDLPVLRLHSDRGGEFSSDLLRAFCRSEGIRQTFTLPASPQQNGIAERRIGMINLQPRVSLPETTPTLRWTGKVGDTSAFRV
ncbi:unnamed protein product [Closterium sp. NIES-53]